MKDEKNRITIDVSCDDYSPVSGMRIEQWK